MRKKEYRERQSRGKRSARLRVSLVESLHAISPQTRRAIGVVSLWASGILFLLSIFDLAGNFGGAISNGLNMFFGAPKLIFPLVLLCCAFALTRNREHKIHLIQLVGFVFFLLSFFAFWHLQYNPDIALDAARDGRGGGLIGFLLADPLQRTVGFWGALVILIAICTSSLLIILNTSLHVFFENLNRISNGVRSFFSELFARTQDERESAELSSGSEDDNRPEFENKTIASSVREIPTERPGKETTAQDAKEDTSLLIDEQKLPKIRQKIQLSIDLLNNRTSQPTSGDVKLNKIIIQKTFENFNIPVEMGEINIGPTITQYTLKPAEGVKLVSITGLHNDLALALAAHPIRIEAPIPGKSLVGIEVPNQKAAIVTLRELLESENFKKRKNNLTFTLGKDVSGTVRLANIAAMPHMLIAGSTGSGKTVCINTLIMSLLFQNGPEDLRFIMVDPKRVELQSYNNIPHLLTPVITDVKKAMNSLRWAVNEMERRFGILSGGGKRDIASYNVKATEKLPYIVIIIDELAEIMQTVGQEVEPLIIRLAQMARAVGIHLILATQRPSTDVITGLIKANITSRIAFAVASQIDSRTILDGGGAERLVGRGDMLFISAELSKPVRIQGAYISDEEIDRVTRILKESGEPEYQEGVVEKPSGGVTVGFDDDEDDDLLSQAREVILQAQKASASLLQRRLSVGYARAARLLDLLEAQGFIGPGNGAKPRELLFRSPEEMDMMPTSRRDDDYSGE